MADAREPRPSLRPAGRPSLPQLVLELRDILVAYFKQETLLPLRELGRYLAFGVAGSVLLGTGVMLLALGCLRLLQTETGEAFDGNWSWVPYVIVFAVLMIGAAVTWTARKAFRVSKELER